MLAAEAIAHALGIPHRREAPLGSDMAADLDTEAFARLQATIAYQADGGMGGWDNVSGAGIGRDSLISGHMGELLKAYAKRMPAGDRIDPIAMVRLQAPFDPMGLLLGDARDRLAGRLADQMDEHRAAGAREGDLPDLFYWRNRIPNWLGGIRGIKSFERQPVLPLGVPALMRLAFLLTPDERKIELAHYRLIEAAAPELLPFPFAHQAWDASLGAPAVPPVTAVAGSNLFGTWQWGINRNPRLRAHLTSIFEGVDVPLWADVDRALVIDRLHNRRFDYFDGISLLGLTNAVLHQAGMVCPTKLASGGPATPVSRAITRLPPLPATPRLAGHLDSAAGAALRDGVLIIGGDGVIGLNGWLQAPDWPGASVAVEARRDGAPIASTAAAGIGDGRHGFLLELDAGALVGASSIRLAGIESDEGPQGGDLRIDRA